MAKNGAVLLYCPLAVFMLGMSLLCKATDEDRKVHIVYLGSLADGVFCRELSREGSWCRPCFGVFSQYLVLILSHSLSSLESLLVRSYKRSFNGFAAKLTDKEREKLAASSSELDITYLNLQGMTLVMEITQPLSQQETLLRS
ncbi:hypothetical protein C1H46_043711 [Malus baccata]|uniref:Inhibitor I9 domain-containing protein n=1 Tax=Malus baccata TaxID=106549 RepID=A0A540K949_MALBA|nr:hypothetical protein C1H46_043711 [Malus baccata]